MNVRNLLVALLVFLTQLHTSVAQTPTPPDARIGPPQFAHGTKLMYALNDMRDIPDGSILKWATFYYHCDGSLITRTSTLGVPFVLTMTLHAYPYEGTEIETAPYPNDPNSDSNYAFYVPEILVYTKTVSLFVSDRRGRTFVSDEMTVTLDFYGYTYGFNAYSTSTANGPNDFNNCQGQLRFAYLPPIVGINAFLPNVNRP